MAIAPIFPNLGIIHFPDSGANLLRISSCIFEYMMKKDSFNDMKECHVNVLHDALQYHFIQEYIGLSNYNIYSGNDIKEFEYKLEQGLLKYLKYDKLNNLFEWLYGNDLENIEPIVKNNDDLKILNMVLFDSSSTNILERTNDLGNAFEYFIN